jgi:ATPase subunit of ABC transporter with duplicated ATPase domains
VARRQSRSRRLFADIRAGDRIGVVGANGAGKSTLLDLVAGRLVPTAGEVDRGATVRIGYYDQLGRQLDTDQRFVRPLPATRANRRSPMSR